MLKLALHPNISEIAPEVWDGLKGDDNPFNAHAYLKALEDAECVGPGTGWQVVHLSLSDEAGVIKGVMPLYAKTHSMGEYVFDQSWAQAYERAGGQYYPKLLSASPFTPVTGARLLSPDPEVRRALIEGAMTVCRQNKLSSLHINFPLEAEWLEMGEMGMLLRQDKQFWWQNDGYQTFDDFLAALSSNRRKVIRRERRDLGHLRFETLVGTEITEAHLDHLYGFIENTYDRKWGTGRPYVTREFFSATPRKDMVLMLAYDGADCIAGAVNYMSHDTLYGRQWGCAVDVPFLHFELCYYRGIDFAITRGLSRVEAGTQGEHKLSRGYLPQPVYSAHFIRDERLRKPIEAYLEEERASVVEQMHMLEDEASPFKKSE
jgi:uncharacterized protein